MQILIVIRVNLNAHIKRQVREVGTTYKGNTRFYRSIGQNIMITSSTYHYENGRFGVSSPSTGNKTRNIASSDPVSTARDFYNKITLGGIEQSFNNGTLKVTRMADGTHVTWRLVSHSDKTSVVDININNSSHTGGIKEQKIHFVEENK